MTTTEVGPDSFDLQVEDFAADIDTLLTGCFPQAPQTQVVEEPPRVMVCPEGQDEHHGGVPLDTSEGHHTAWLRVYYVCTPNSSGDHLAIGKSKIWLEAVDDSNPLFRFEYSRRTNRVPTAHIHVHGERDTLADVLMSTGRSNPRMVALHLPTGGSRFRPELEDVIQFLVDDCGFAAASGWRAVLEQSRARWRAIQTRTVVQAMPEEAVNQLRSMGYDVEAR